MNLKLCLFIQSIGCLDGQGLCNVEQHYKQELNQASPVPQCLVVAAVVVVVVVVGSRRLMSPDILQPAGLL